MTENFSPDTSESLNNLKTQYNQQRINYRKLIREQKAIKSVERDNHLFSDPGSIYRKIKASKKAKAGKIQN